MISKKVAIMSFAVIQIALIFFYIYMQSMVIQLTYAIQDSERAFHESQKKKKELTQALLQEQDVQKLKSYATYDLRMKKARLSDIKELPVE